MNLLRYAADPRNVIGANNPYDVEYFKYFTGYTPQLIRTYGDYYGLRYNAKRPGFIMTGHRGNIYTINNKHRLIKEYKQECNRVNCSVWLNSTQALYNRSDPEDLVMHQGIVYLPYQVITVINLAIIMQFFNSIPFP